MRYFTWTKTVGDGEVWKQNWMRRQEDGCVERWRQRDLEGWVMFLLQLSNHEASLQRHNLLYWGWVITHTNTDTHTCACMRIFIPILYIHLQTYWHNLCTDCEWKHAARRSQQTIRVFSAAQSDVLNNNGSGLQPRRQSAPLLNSHQTHTVGLWEKRDDKDGCFSCLYYLSICRLCNASIILLCCIHVSDGMESEGVKMLSTRHTSSSEAALLDWMNW